MRRTTGIAAGLAALAALSVAASPAPAGPVPRTVDPDPREVRFGPLTMLTDGGENAEAYFSFAGDRLVFQSTREGVPCDQIMVLPVDGDAPPRLVSTGRGRTTCAYFLPGDSSVVYASTHLADAACPPPPDMSRGYVWSLYEGYDIFRADLAGGEPRRLTDTPGYDAEATVSPRGDRIVFTSVRDGDLEIYSMDLEGGDVTRLTHEPGYDGGPFFSPDGRRIVYRAHHPEPGTELDDYRDLLARGLVRPSLMEIWIMDADGGNKRQVTALGCASFAPYFHPSGGRIVFSTNHPEPGSREFDLWLVDLDGGNLERVTFGGGFDGFPMWAPDGRTFVFCSNRHNSAPGETNVFVTEWRE